MDTHFYNTMYIDTGREQEGGGYRERSLDKEKAIEQGERKRAEVCKKKVAKERGRKREGFLIVSTCPG